MCSPLNCTQRPVSYRVCKLTTNRWTFLPTLGIVGLPREYSWGQWCQVISTELLAHIWLWSLWNWELELMLIVLICNTEEVSSSSQQEVNNSTSTPCVGPCSDATWKYLCMLLVFQLPIMTVHHVRWHCYIANFSCLLERLSSVCDQCCVYYH